MNDIDEEMNSSAQESSDADEGTYVRDRRHRRVSMEVSANDANKKEMTSHFESINELQKEEDSGEQDNLETMSVQEELVGHFDEFGQFNYKNLKYKNERKRK